MNDWVDVQADVVHKLHVKVGRQQRKIDKLKNARDHFKQLAAQYKTVLSHFPHIQRAYDRYTDHVNEQKRVKNLEQRVKEQEMLIRYLSGGKIQDWEIKKFYDEWIQERHRTNTVK